MSVAFTYDPALGGELRMNDFESVNGLTFMVDYRYVVSTPTSPFARPCHRLLQLCGVLELFTSLRELNVVIHSMPTLPCQEVVIKTLLTVSTVRDCERVAFIDSAQYTETMRRLEIAADVQPAYLEWAEEICMFPLNVPGPCMIESVVWGVEDPSMLSRLGLSNLRQATVVFDANCKRSVALLGTIRVCESLSVPFLAIVGRCAPSLLELFSLGNYDVSPQFLPSVLATHESKRNLVSERHLRHMLQEPHARHISGISFARGRIIEAALRHERVPRLWSYPEWDSVRPESDHNDIGHEFLERRIRRGKHRPFLAMFLTTLAIMRANAGCRFLVDSAMMGGVNDVIYNFVYHVGNIKMCTGHMPINQCDVIAAESHAPWIEACKKLQKASSTRFAVHVTSIPAPPPPPPRKLIIRGRKRKVVPQ